MASPATPSGGQTNLGMAPNVAAMLCYFPLCCIGIVFSIVAVVVEKQSRFVRFHAFQSLLVHAALIVVVVAMQVFSFVLAAVSGMLVGGGGSPVVGEKPSETVAEQRARIAREGTAMQLLPACPLMHGTGQFTAYNALGGGGAIVTCESQRLDPVELWSTAAARGTAAIAIVGDAFAKPMLRALEENPGRFDLAPVKLIVSSGVLWSPAVKQGLLRHMPHAQLMDSFGSSEAMGFGTELTTKDTTVSLGRFKLGPNCKVFTPDGREVTPGSGEAGFVARSGPIPLGYYRCG